MQTIHLTYAAPIPVGHRVEIRWYVKPGKGGFFGGKDEEQPFAPFVCDLDTGVEYVSDWLFDHQAVKHTKTPLHVEEPIRGDLEIQQTLRGIVKGTRVIMVEWSDQTVQTRLFIEPE